MQQVWKGVKHNTGLAVAVIFCIMLTLWGFACDSVVASITNPERKITRDELAVEVKQEAARIERDASLQVRELQIQIDTILSKAQVDAEALQAVATAREKQLNTQDNLKGAILNVGLAIAEGGTINPAGVIFTMAGALGLGAIVDNRRKDGLIVDIKETAVKKALNGSAAPS